MKPLLFIATIAILFAACTKDTVKVPESKSAIPDELVGKWQLGNFNIQNFSSYNGTRPASIHNTIAYNIAKDGTAEQYIYLNADDGSDLQTLTYRKGTINFDPATRTWKFCPSSGNFRKFQNNQKTQGDINSDGLYPKYAPAYSNYYLENNNQSVYMGVMNDYNEDLTFQKVSW